MGRLPIIPVEEMTEEQKQIQESIAGGKRGGFRGPFNVWVYRPEYLKRLDKVGEYVRFLSVLPPRLSEFAILITACHWSAQYEWFAHEPHALKGGLDPEIIAAVRDRRRPEGMQPDEAALYDFCIELHENKSVSDASYQEAINQFGVDGTVDLTVLVGHYAMVSMTLNAFEVPLPEGVEPPLSISPAPDTDKM